jgi:hypothetical protein
MKLLARAIGAVAVLFGLMTIKEGGSVLFWSESARLAAGDFVSFVLWFNFLAGFLYVVAGYGLLRLRRWSAGLSMAIALMTALVFAAFGVHIAFGGAFEQRTVVAMFVRTSLWTGFALLARRSLSRRSGETRA